MTTLRNRKPAEGVDFERFTARVRAVKGRMRVVSLDAPGRLETIPSPEPDEADSDAGSELAADPLRAAMDFVAFLSYARDVSTLAQAARDFADDATRQEAAAVAQAEHFARLRQLNLRASDVGTLSRGQLDILAAKLALIAEGENPSHHAVARRLGLSHSNVATQWRRVVAKLGVSTSGLSTPDDPAA